MSRAHPALRPLLTAADRPVSDLAEARAARRALAGERGGISARQRRITDVAGPGVRLRVYEPPRRISRGLLVLVHGGGFVWGGIDEVDSLARALAVASGRTTAAVAYRLAPEHRYPAALDDVSASLAWLRANGSQHDADPTDIVLLGLSAGGALAAAASARCRDDGDPVAAQVLCYPMLDPTLSTASAHEFADAAPLTRGRAAWFWAQYVPEESRGDPGAVPVLERDLAGLPPTYVVLAEVDVLRDEGLEYVARLRAAGVRAGAVTWPGTVHGFLTMGALVPELCAAALADMAAWINAALPASDASEAEQ